MTPMKKIVIGTRGSDLALTQADITTRALKTIDPTLVIEVRVITTHGDIDQRPVPLDTVGKGWFTKEIEAELLAGTIDIAVHSLKDVTENMPPGLMLAAYLPREDARDVLVTKHGESLEALKQGAIIGTDSPRRQVQMLALRSDAVMKSLRGNVPTRLRKLKGDEAEGAEYDAIVLAAAGLKRLGLEKKITRYFEPQEMVPAPGQGTLVIQTRDVNSDINKDVRRDVQGDEWLQKLLARINDPDASHAALIERAFARAVGAGCKSPVGAYASRIGDAYRLIGMIANDDGSNMVRGEIDAFYDKSEDLGERLAQELLAKRGKSK